MLIVGGVPLLSLGAIVVKWAKGGGGAPLYWCCFYVGASLVYAFTLGMTSMVGVGGGFGALIFLDQVGILFVALSALVGLLSLVAMVLGTPGFTSRGLMLCFLMLMLSLFGVFTVSGGMFFFVCFELCVLPIFLLISKWGAQVDRVFSGYYFFFYSVITPAPLLLFFLKITAAGFGSLPCLIYGGEASSLGAVGMAVLLLGFLTKLPLYGLHIWLPKAHVDAPVGGSMVLAGVMLKMGGFGLVRLHQLNVLHLKQFVGVPEGLIIFLGMAGFFATSLVCLRLVDYKVIVAFSSVGHMSIAALGLIVGVGWGFMGGLYVFVGHGIVSPLLFYVGGVLYSRFGSRLVTGWGGVGSTWGPIFYGAFLLMFMFNFGFPPFLNFFGELGIFYGVLAFSYGLGLVVFVGYLFSGIYMLNVVVSMTHGPLPTGPGGSSSYMKSTCSAGEWFLLWALVLTYVLLGAFVMKLY
uniref:NADH-ubiquinone oxidoreductase chain 4 n=1 Tax=Phallusia mammillata TaxID=59560 RepID=A7WL69_9ASCI|nr:NADH dehydrogenase subunit 4 [Phallusia mammillata]CAL23082.2 NADH dehydrogenase subunit 4 [Phallusia mammillata]